MGVINFVQEGLANWRRGLDSTFQLYLQWARWRLAADRMPRSVRSLQWRLGITPRDASVLHVRGQEWKLTVAEWKKCFSFPFLPPSD